ncbi:MAG: DNA ligase [Mycobacteriaceae bacterium]|nr:DNA ligase [Mycobacteriaceae bacterium]
MVVIDDGVTVFTRNGADVTRTFPEVASGVAGAVGGRPVVLDGEIVALDQAGRPSFERLQRRWPQQRRPKPELLRQVPVRFFAFDVLARDGEDIVTWPYLERRALLDSLAVVETSKTLTVPRFWTDVSPAVMLEVAAENSVEGIVVKRVDSPYRPGRSNLWLKCPLRATAELIIAGYLPSSGPAGRVGSLLIAGRDGEGRLVLVGQVGTGFSESARRQLFGLLHRIQRRTPPVVNAPAMDHGIRWVEPNHVGEVAYRNYRPGRGLRHTSWKGLREDTDPSRIGLPG